MQYIILYDINIEGILVFMLNSKCENKYIVIVKIEIMYYVLYIDLWLSHQLFFLGCYIKFCYNNIIIMLYPTYNIVLYIIYNYSCKLIQ